MDAHGFDTVPAIAFGVVWAFAPFFIIGAYKADVYEARQRLRSMFADYDMRKTTCFCCQVDHLLPNGDKIPCDREFVEGGISKWFDDCQGSGLDGFSTVMRTEVREVTEQALGKQSVLPLGILCVFFSQTIWLLIGQALINDGYPGINHRFKVGTGLEIILSPFAVIGVDAVTGAALTVLSQWRTPQIRLRFYSGLVFFLGMAVNQVDFIYLNEKVPMWVAVLHLVGTIGVAVAARHFAS